MKPKVLKYIRLAYENNRLIIGTNYPDEQPKDVQIKYANVYSIFVYIARIFRSKRNSR